MLKKDCKLCKKVQNIRFLRKNASKIGGIKKYLIVH